MRRLPLLVTGATGHVGHAVVRALAARRPLVLLVRPGRDEGARERVARLFPGDGEASPRVRAALAAGDVEVVEGDVSEPGLGLVAAARARLAATLGGIVHLAARTDFASGDAADYRPANVDGTRHVAELALAAGCPLVHASTHAVAGDRAGTIAEDDLDVGQGFHNGYERSKLEAEVLLRGLGAERGLAAACLRLGIVLPDAPVDGIPTGSGPLVYLEHLERDRFVYAEGSLHGKTAGSLSVTGREKYRAHVRRFEDWPMVPFGDAAALARAFAGDREKRIAGAILEPIQGEAGVVVPPAATSPRRRGSRAPTGRSSSWTRSRRRSAARARSSAARRRASPPTSSASPSRSAAASRPSGDDRPPGDPAARLRADQRVPRPHLDLRRAGAGVRGRIARW